MTTPTNILFSADRALRDAASSYSSAIFGTSKDMLRVREDELRQAALDFAKVAKHIDAAASSIDFHEGMPEVIARVEEVTK